MDIGTTRGRDRTTSRLRNRSIDPRGVPILPSDECFDTRCQRMTRPLDTPRRTIPRGRLPPLGPACVKNSDARLARGKSFSISSITKSVALMASICGLQLSKQFLKVFLSLRVFTQPGVNRRHFLSVRRSRSGLPPRTGRSNRPARFGSGWCQRTKIGCANSPLRG